MSKVIKVEDTVYNQLDNLRVGRQTFSDVIDEMLTARLRMLEAINVLEGSLRFREWQRQQLDPMSQARLERADLDARTLKR